MNNIVRAVITQENSNGTYNVRVAGSEHDMTNVPCLNFVTLPVGLSVCLDMSDPQTPQIIASANAGVRWAGEPTRTTEDVDTMYPDGWHFHFGTWGNGAGYESPITPDKRHTEWKVPYNVDSTGTNKTGVQIMRTASWTRGEETCHAVITYGETFQSAVLGNCFIAWDARNTYKLKNTMPAPPSPVTNTSNHIVSATATSFADRGKVIVVHGMDSSKRYLKENIFINEFLEGSSSNPLASIFKIEVFNIRMYEGRVLWKPAVLSGDTLIGCGAITKTLPTGTQVFLFSREEIELIATADSLDPYTQIESGDILLIENEFVEVHGLVSKTNAPVFGVDTNTIRIVINGRGMYGPPPSEHPANAPVMHAYWVAPESNDIVNTLESATNVIIDQGRILYAGISLAGVVASSRNLKTGELLWTTKTPEYTTGSTPAFVGVVHNQVSSEEPPEVTPTIMVVHEVKNDGSASKWFGFDADTGEALYNYSGSAYYSNDQVIYCVCNPATGIIFQHVRKSVTVNGVTNIQRVFKTYDGVAGGLIGSSTYSFSEVDKNYEENFVLDPDGNPIRVSYTLRGYAHTYVQSPSTGSVDLIFTVRQQTVYDKIGTALSDPDLKYDYQEWGDIENRVICYRVSDNSNVTTVYNEIVPNPTGTLSSAATPGESRLLGVLGYSEDTEPHMYAVYSEWALKEIDVDPDFPLLKFRYVFPLGSRLVSVNTEDGSTLGFSSSYLDSPSSWKTNYYTVKNTWITESDVAQWEDLARHQYYKPLGVFFVNASVVPGDGLFVKQWTPTATEKGGNPPVDADFAALSWSANDTQLFVNGHLACASLRGMCFIGRLKYYDPEVNIDDVV